MPNTYFLPASQSLPLWALTTPVFGLAAWLESQDYIETSGTLSSETSQETLPSDGKQVLKDEHFDHVDYAYVGMTDSDSKRFKMFYLGTKLPPQKGDTQKLREAGFGGINPWATAWLESLIMNS